MHHRQTARTSPNAFWLLAMDRMPILRKSWGAKNGSETKTSALGWWLCHPNVEILFFYRGACQKSDKRASFFEINTNQINVLWFLSLGYCIVSQLQYNHCSGSKHFESNVSIPGLVKVLVHAWQWDFVFDKHFELHWPPNHHEPPFTIWPHDLTLCFLPCCFNRVQMLKLCTNVICG